MSQETAKVEEPLKVREPPQKILEYKKMLDEYKVEKENYYKLWKVFSDNVLTEDFRRSKWSALAFIFVPTMVNLYFLRRPDAIFKNTLRISSILACYCNLHHQLNQDFTALMKKDTPLANRAREYVHNIAQNDMRMPDFSKEVYEITSKTIAYYAK